MEYSYLMIPENLCTSGRLVIFEGLNIEGRVGIGTRFLTDVVYVRSVPYHVNLNDGYICIGRVIGDHMLYDVLVLKTPFSNSWIVCMNHGTNREVFERIYTKYQTVLPHILRKIGLSVTTN